MEYPRYFLKELLERTALSEIIRAHVTLRHNGREFLGLCPFHQEKTPSFTVNDDKGFYHCFGCSAHGDALAFLTEHQHFSFDQAVRHLATQAGISIPSPRSKDKDQSDKQASIFRTLDAANRWFSHQLTQMDASAARDYLDKRSISADMIKHFSLGFAPSDGQTMIKALENQSITKTQMTQAGLLTDDGRNRYRSRIIFPIYDFGRRSADNKPVVRGFGGRLLAGKVAKYINSPQTEVFTKKRLLYGLYQGRDAIQKQQSTVVVEGYLDVISLHQAGLPTAVAPLGTAVSEDHLGTLWRLCPRPVLCFDGDAAGRRAAWSTAMRALPELRPDRSLAFVFLPEGEDPDSFVRSQGLEAFKGLITHPAGLADFIWQAQRSALDGAIATPEQWAGLQTSLNQLSAMIGHPGTRYEYRRFFRQTYHQSRPFYPKSHPSSNHRRKPPTKVLSTPSRPDGDACRLPMVKGDIVRKKIILLGAINHPELLVEFSEEIASIDIIQPLLDLRNRLLDLVAESPNIDTRKEVQSYLEQYGHGPDIERYLLPILPHAPDIADEATKKNARQCLQNALSILNLSQMENELRLAHRRHDGSQASSLVLSQLRQEILRTRQSLSLLQPYEE